MAANDQWDQAIGHLELAIANLGTAPPEARYRSFLYFNQGHIHEKRLGPNRTDYLKQAQRSYQLALKERPGYLKAINNLILVSKKLGDYDTALRYIEVMKKTDSTSTSKWDLLAGDIYREQRNAEQSWFIYKKAGNSDPSRRETALKLIDTYKDLPPEFDRRLIEQCEKFKSEGKAEMARLGFEEIMRIRCDSESTYLEKALLGWCGVLAANNWVRPRLVSYINRLDCELPALAYLGKNITGAWQIRPQNTWWYENDRRKFYYLAIQKSWADYLLSIGKKKEAMELYIALRNERRGIRDLSKQIYGRPNFLEIETLVQLARLYSDKSLNPEGDKFRTLEMELFEGKGSAYIRGDLPGIQKFHTILALIYVHRGQWEGGSSYARNAIFQLEQAISTAEDRTKKDPQVYKPIPHLHRYLSMGYQESAIGNQESDKLEKAANSSISAAIDYLETDNLRLSQQMIKKSDSLRPYIKNEAVLLKQAGAKSIYQARAQVTDLDAGAFEIENTKYYRGTSTYNWLDNPSLIQEIDRKIVDRQKFKVVSDLSIQAKKVGAINASGNLKREAKVNANNVNIYSSQQDIIRLKKIDVIQNNLINYQSFPENDRNIKRDIKSGDKYLLPDQNDQMKRVIVPQKEGNR